jgi:hypothetical protein
MTYTAKDLGYKRTSTDAIYRLEMPDGSVWDVPIQAIADSRDDHYAEDREDTVGEIRDGRIHESAIDDWAENNMNWSDVSKFAVRAPNAKPKPVDYEDGWSNGLKDIIGRI